MLNILPNSYLKKTFLNYLDSASVRDLHEFLFIIEGKLGIGGDGSVSKSGESVVLDILARHIPEAKIIFDVGANVGQYADQIFDQFSQQTNFDLHCFEPSKPAFDTLQPKFANHESVILNNIGLGAEEKEAVLYMNKQCSGLASLTKRKLDHIEIDHGALSETVQISTIDKYCKKNSIPHINLLKIDVEGHELDVLKGSAAMLSERKIDLVQFEFGGCNIDTRTFFQDFHCFFAELEFELFRILPGNKLMKLPKYREIDEKFRTTNFLAAPKSMKLNIRYREHCV